MYTMKEICKLTGLSYETLKYYCNVDLIPNVNRDNCNRRVFSDGNLSWIQCMIQLKKLGFTIDELKLFLNYCLIGESTIPERNELLSKKKEQLLLQIQDLQSSLDFVEEKQRFYNAVLSGTQKYYCPLLADQTSTK